MAQAFLFFALPLFSASNNPAYISLDGPTPTLKLKSRESDPGSQFEATQRRIDFSQKRDFQCALFGGGATEYSGNVRFPTPAVDVPVSRNDKWVRSNVALTAVKEIRFQKYKSRPVEDSRFEWLPGESVWALWDGGEIRVKKPVEAMMKLRLEPDGPQGVAKTLYTYFVDYLVKGFWVNAKKKADHRLELVPPDAVIRRIVFQEEFPRPR
jgi:hypothetical protein